MSNQTNALQKIPNFTPRKGPVVLIVMDGIGIGKQDGSDAVYLAKTPNLDQLKSSALYTQLKAHGTAVGMPSDDDMGNSEVGHNALGAGRVFNQGASLVKNAIDSKTLFQGETWQDALQNAISNNSTLHFIGLLSDGNVHSHINHLLEMLSQASEKEVEKCRVHILCDGRDVYERSALNYIEILEGKLTDINQKDNRDYKIASGGGRMITTMDRYDADWSIVKRGWDAHVLGQAEAFPNATTAVQTFYDNDPKITDQYLPAFVIQENGHPVGTIEDNDSVIFFNFRGDRAIELTKAFEQTEFEKFDRQRHPTVFYAGMMQYDGDEKLPQKFLVEPPDIDKPISHYLCQLNIPSFAISETQKYGHVTYFWNGNNSGYINEAIEEYVEIESDKIPFDQRPEMKAYEITDKTIELLQSGKFKFGRINYPNGDMVGHTGNIDATVKSVEVTDECVGKIVEVVNQLGGITIVLADHGNADEMYTVKNGEKIPKTAHSLNPVPCMIVDSQFQNDYRFNDIKEPGLANVAATICNLLGYQQPEEYEPSLIVLS